MVSVIKVKEIQGSSFSTDTVSWNLYLVREYSFSRHTTSRNGSSEAKSTPTWSWWKSKDNGRSTGRTWVRTWPTHSCGWMEHCKDRTFADMGLSLGNVWKRTDFEFLVRTSVPRRGRPSGQSCVMDHWLSTTWGPSVGCFPETSAEPGSCHQRITCGPTEGTGITFKNGDEEAREQRQEILANADTWFKSMDILLPLLLTDYKIQHNPSIYALLTTIGK